MRPTAMPPELIDDAVTAAAALLELPLAAEHRPGVLRFFALAAEMAQVVSAVPLQPADESGAVFRPVEPGPRHGQR